MGRENFNPTVGDIVRIRDWDDMMREFGLSDFGNINCQFAFLKVMKRLCGQEFKITHIEQEGYYHGHGSSWSISKDMLEYADDTPFDTEEIGNFLSEIAVR